MRGVRARRSTFFLALAACLLTVALVQTAAAPARADGAVSITSLIEDMKKYDDQQVTIEGEVIGDIMVRGDRAWITVNDDPYSRRSIEEGGALVGMSNVGIGVWVPASGARQITVLGGYKNRGAKVRLSGVFHRACAEHGGDTDIHAGTLEIIQPGHPFRHAFQWEKLATFLALCSVIAILWYWRMVKRRKWAKEE
jgi:hypothetical protein